MQCAASQAAGWEGLQPHRYTKGCFAGSVCSPTGSPKGIFCRQSESVTTCQAVATSQVAGGDWMETRPRVRDAGSKLAPYNPLDTTIDLSSACFSPKQPADAPQSLDHARHGGLPAAGSKCVPFLTDRAFSGFQACGPLSARALAAPDRGGAGREARDAGEAAPNTREGGGMGGCAGRAAWRVGSKGVLRRPRVCRRLRRGPASARSPMRVRSHVSVHATHPCMQAPATSKRAPAQDEPLTEISLLKLKQSQRQPHKLEWPQKRPFLDLVWCVWKPICSSSGGSGGGSSFRCLWCRDRASTRPTLRLPPLPCRAAPRPAAPRLLQGEPGRERRRHWQPLAAQHQGAAHHQGL